MLAVLKDLPLIIPTRYVVDLYLILEISSLKNQKNHELDFCWLSTQAVKIKLEIDKKSSLSNLIF
jgi:hypothetical protein